VVPGAADCVVDDEAFGQRSPIVRAASGDCEYLRTVAYQQYRLAVAMAEKPAAIGKIGDRNAMGEIGSARL
jgi:hypothetical protein